MIDSTVSSAMTEEFTTCRMSAMHKVCNILRQIKEENKMRLA